MKEKIKKEYFRRIRKLLKTKLYSRNLTKRNKYLGCSHRKIFGTILEVDQRRTNGSENKKTSDMHKALHPRDDVDTLYVSRKEGERGLTSIEDSVDTSIQQLEDYIQRRGGRLITST